MTFILPLPDVTLAETPVLTLQPTSGLFRQRLSSQPRSGTVVCHQILLGLTSFLITSKLTVAFLRRPIKANIPSSFRHSRQIVTIRS